MPRPNDPKIVCEHTAIDRGRWMRRRTDRPSPHRSQQGRNEMHDLRNLLPTTNFLAGSVLSITRGEPTLPFIAIERQVARRVLRGPLGCHSRKRYGDAITAASSQALYQETVA